jgi:hypothetical protein
MILKSRTLALASRIIPLIATIATASAEVHRLKPEEMALSKRIWTHSGQGRNKMTLDPILCKVARQRAADMARQDYFGHVNPLGQGPNYLVRRAGFALPAYYDRSRSGNNIESIGMGISTPREIVSLWCSSSGHRPHVLGENSFYKAQTAVGVGIYRSTRPPFCKYYVFLSAPPNPAVTSQSIILKDPKGNTLSPTKTLAQIVAGA